MRPSAFFVDGDMLPIGVHEQLLNEQMMADLRRAPLPDAGDAEVGVALARLVHDNLEHYGTDGAQALSESEIQEAIAALIAVLRRLGFADFRLPFRSYRSFRSWWIRQGSTGSWQARRNLLDGLFDLLHEQLADMEQAALASSLASPISPHTRTGWSAVDTEIGELRRHFETAHTPGDYRAVGLDCVAVLEALSRRVYDPERHLPTGEPEPPVSRTKERISRFVEHAAPVAGDADLRTLARNAIEFAQHVKHSATPTRRNAGIAADAVILLANILRRLDEPA